MLALAGGLCEDHFCLTLVKAFHVSLKNAVCDYFEFGFILNLISIIGVKIKFTIITIKYEVDSATQFTKNSILRPMKFTETTRQRES